MNAGDNGVLGVGGAEWGSRGCDREEDDKAPGEQMESRRNILTAHELGGESNEASIGGDWSQTAG